MCVRLKENGWLIAKVVLVLFFLAIGPSMISDLRAEDAPPLWIAPLVLLGGFIMGLVSRFASRTPPWTERELWLANPFRYVFKFRDTEKVYYPPWIHLGALTFIGGLRRACLLRLLPARDDWTRGDDFRHRNRLVDWNSTAGRFEVQEVREALPHSSGAKSLDFQFAQPVRHNLSSLPALKSQIRNSILPPAMSWAGL